jgi:hypothetical protein
MGISLTWRLVTPKLWRSLPRGTSTDWAAFEQIFGRRPLGFKDVATLHAMHLATGHKESMWGDLAEVLGSLPDGEEIEVRGEY